MTLMPCITVPHLTTATRTPLHTLEKTILENHLKIETWLREKFNHYKAPITSSVDLRNAGFKISPVDTNLYPAGFNNLNPDFMPLCIQAMQSYVFTAHPNCKRVLIIPESHTRNEFYAQSLFTLQNILNLAGFDTRIGSLMEDLKAPLFIPTNKGNELILEPIQRQGERVRVDGFEPCMILLNNDLSSGVPELLKGLSQTIRPHLNLGWSNRLKSNHFKHYQSIASEFADLIGIDSWLVQPLFDVANDIDFKKSEGAQALADKVDLLLSLIQQKYDQYNISQQPFVVVKANSGTYGMSVMMVKSGQELLELNRKKRNKMAASKGAKPVTSVIIQEGVYTFETWQDKSAISEPVIYMLGQYVVGGFYRVHRGKAIDENLNAPGMHFEPLAFDKACNSPDKELAPSECPNRFYAYGVIARLANLAAAIEIDEVTCQPSDH